MKKHIRAVALVSAVIMLFAASGCGGKTPAESIRQQQTKEEFAPSSGGETSCSVDITVPVFKEKYFEQAEALNRYFENFVKEETARSESEKDNAADFMSKREGGGPWDTVITYEIKYLDAKYLDILFRFDHIYGTISSGSAYRNVCFNLETGSTVALDEFFVTEGDNACRNRFVALVCCRAEEQCKNAYGVSTLKPEMEKEDLKEYFDTESWFLTGEGITAWFGENSICQKSVGTIFVPLTKTDCEEFFVLPQ